MSDELKRQLDTALAKIAQLEVQVANRPQSSTPTPGLDPQQVARAMAADPIGTMTRLGIPVEHVTRVMVAHQLGDAAPPELRVLAQQGPLMSATQAIAQDLQAMRQRLETFEERDRTASRRQSFSALATDKSKYPTLAAAYAKHPELFDSDAASFQGDAAAYAESQEKRLAALAPALGAPPPASSGNADTNGQSSQAKQARGVSGIDPTPPPISNAKPGLLTPETDAELKARILAKYPTEPRG